MKIGIEGVFDAMETNITEMLSFSKLVTHPNWVNDTRDQYQLSMWSR